MNKQFLYGFIILTIFANCVCLNAAAQNVQAEAKLDQGTIRIGDQTKLRLTVYQTAKEHINFPKIADTLTGKVQVINNSKPDTAFDKNNHSRLTVTQSYTLTSFDPGTYTIPSLAFASAAGIIKTNALTLQVQSVKVDTTKAIYDIKQPLIVSYTFFDWLRDNWGWVLLALLAIIFIVGLVWYLKKRPKIEEVIPKTVNPVIPAHTIALARLNELQHKKLWQQDEVKQYYSELSDILREYIERRYQVRTQEKTTDEIFIGIKYLNIEEGSRNKLRQILTLADLVKFAKEKPLRVENEQSMDNAVAFVNNTQPVIQAPGFIKGGNADELV